jgi:hypothetical protein
MANDGQFGVLMSGKEITLKGVRSKAERSPVGRKPPPRAARFAASGSVRQLPAVMRRPFAPDETYGVGRVNRR